MTVSLPLERHWGASTDTHIATAIHVARDSVSAFGDATKQSGSMLQSWIQGQSVVEFDHYPANDVVDRRGGSQFYYHSHRHGDAEHGHLHLFWHATASARRRYLRPDQANWQRTAPTHLFAISLDPRGLPINFFTVNQWVTEGHWFDAATTMACVNRFSMRKVAGHENACRWLTGFIRFYRPLLADLLRRRDARLMRRSNLAHALKDRRLEILSASQIDWAADLDALQMQAKRRGVPGANL